MNIQPISQFNRLEKTKIALVLAFSFFLSSPFCFPAHRQLACAGTPPRRAASDCLILTTQSDSAYYHQVFMPKALMRGL